jgi:hypothetical protein
MIYQNWGCQFAIHHGEWTGKIDVIVNVTNKKDESRRLDIWTDEILTAYGVTLGSKERSNPKYKIARSVNY